MIPIYQVIAGVSAGMFDRGARVTAIARVLASTTIRRPSPFVGSGRGRRLGGLLPILPTVLVTIFFEPALGSVTFFWRVGHRCGFFVPSGRRALFPARYSRVSFSSGCALCCLRACPALFHACVVSSASHACHQYPVASVFFTGR